MSGKAFCLIIKVLLFWKNITLSRILKYLLHMKQKSKFCSRTTNVHLYDVMQTDILEMESNINLLVEQRQDFN